MFGYFSHYATIKKIVIPVFCVFHMTAIAWWTLPRSFAGMVAENHNQITLETNLFKWFNFTEKNWPSIILTRYIDITASQQYWDFFAPQSPKFHQYLSVCSSLDTDKSSEEINCAGATLFSNLKPNMDTYAFFSSSSRYYRLTETLINQNNPELFKAFTHYYLTHQANNFSNKSSSQLVLHQFELYPDLKELSKAGYRTDTILWETY